jgi:hypothetical protein
LFRIENGSITELLEDFLEVTKGYVVPAGTVVVFTSAEFVGARRKLLGVFQESSKLFTASPSL